MLSEPYTFKTIWSEPDQEFVGLCEEFPSLSHLDPDEATALAGIKDLVTFIRDPDAETEHGKKFEAWCERYMDTRDSLALRKIRGEQLTPMESALLDALNENLEELLPETSVPLPPECIAAMEAVLALRDK